MQCPKCKERLSVKATVPTGEQQTCRTYVCKKCGFMDISIECFEKDKKEEQCQKQPTK